jgi:hypothetical protein
MSSSEHAPEGPPQPPSSLLPPPPPPLSAARVTEVLKEVEVGSVINDISPSSSRDMRRDQRRSVQSCRPVTMVLLDEVQRPMTPWFMADILDIGAGGMCLMISDQHPFQVGQLLMLDVRTHPAFGRDYLQAELRWFVKSRMFSTCGVAFSVPLGTPPELELERRTRRRDLPEQDSWDAVWNDRRPFQ